MKNKSNAIFASTTGRFAETATKNDSSEFMNNSQSKYGSLVNTAKFGFTQQKSGGKFYNQNSGFLGTGNDFLNQTTMTSVSSYFGNSKPQKAAFNAKSPRFNYSKQEKLINDTPGPGDYSNDHGNSNMLIQTQSSKYAFNQTIQPDQVQAASHMFRDTTDRNDFKSYLQIQKAIDMQNMGPGAYFKDKQPFTRKTYNTSLPDPRFT